MNATTAQANATPALIIDQGQAPAAGYHFSYGYLDRFIAWIAPGKDQEKTARTYIVNLRQFAAYLLYHGIEAPQRSDIIAYKDYLITEHEAIQLDSDTPAGWSYRLTATGEPVLLTCKPTTAKQYLQSVKQFFSWTAAEGLYPDIAKNVKAPKVRTDTHKKDALTVEEVRAIEESIKENAQDKLDTVSECNRERATEQGKRLYAMYLLAVNAGLRTVEISRAKVKDLETKGGQTWLYIHGKGHSEADQKKAIAPEVAKAIREYLNARTDSPTKESPLFVATGNRSGGKPIATTTISTMLKRAMQAAGYDSDRLTAHSLRHTAGTAVQELTGDLYQTQHYMRHQSPVTTEIYLHTDTETQDAVTAQRLYNLYHGKQEDSREALDLATAALNPEQLRQLTEIAKAMHR